MHKLYSPETEMDLAFLKSLLESENIAFFVHNDHFGSLKIGPKIDLFNAKTIFVSEGDVETAEALVDNYLQAQNTGEHPTDPTAYSLATKMRIIIEALIFSWFIPQGRTWKKQARSG